jgi:hypothetical protein
MQGLQALLDRYPDIGAGCTVHLAPGVYPENVALGGNHGGLLVEGAGDGPDPATASHLVGQGGPLNLDVLLVTASGPGAGSPTTVRNLRLTSPGGTGTDTDPDAPLYGGVTLEATPPGAGLLQFVRLEHLTVTSITGRGTGCGILITGSSATADLVTDVAVAGCRLDGNGHAGLLVTGTRADNLDIGADAGGRHSLFRSNGGSGLLLLGAPSGAKGPGQFANLTLSESTFHGNLPYDIELRRTDLDIDATQECVFVGAATPADIEARIWHENDDPLLGLVTFVAPDLAGNRLSWDPATRRFTLNGALLSTGTQWYNLGSPAGAQAQIQVLTQATVGSAVMLSLDLTGEDHADATPVTMANTLCNRWYLKGPAITRISETSTLAGRTQTGTYEASLNRTTYGRTVKTGLWVFTHTILSESTILRDIEQRAP